MENHLIATIGYSPKTHEDVAHKEISVEDLEIIARILGKEWFDDNEAFFGQTAEWILDQANEPDTFLIAIEPLVPENFTVFKITREQCSQLREITDKYPVKYPITEPIQLFLG